jgi:hypothetical protein
MAWPISAIRCSIEHMIESYWLVPTVRRPIGRLPAVVPAANPGRQNDCSVILPTAARDEAHQF